MKHIPYIQNTHNWWECISKILVLPNWWSQIDNDLQHILTLSVGLADSPNSFISTNKQINKSGLVNILLCQTKSSCMVSCLLFLLHSWTMLTANWSLTYLWKVCQMRKWVLRPNAFIAKMGSWCTASIPQKELNHNILNTDTDFLLDTLILFIYFIF